MSDFPLDIHLDVVPPWGVVDDPAADAVILRDGDYPVFRPNILVETVELAEDKTLMDFAQVFVERVEPTSLNVEVLQRRELGSAESPGLFQAVQFQIDTEEHGRLDMLQTSVFLAVRDEVSGRRWGCALTLTALRDDARVAGPEFERLVASCNFSTPQAPAGESAVQ